MDHDDDAGMKVTVQVQDRTFTIPVGKGEQSMRWLALVVAHRYSLAHKSRGRSRQRESNLSPSGAFLPRNVVSAISGSVLGPSVKVKDVVAAQAHAKATAGLDESKLDPDDATGSSADINVELMQSSELNDDESLKVSTWSALAFKWSDVGRAKAMALQQADEEAERLRLAEEARRRAVARQKSVEALAREMELAAAIADQSRLDAMMQRDWTHIRLNLATTNPLEQQSLKRILLDQFGAISDVFKFHSVQSAVSEDAFAMRYAEFRHVVDVSGILQFSKDQAVLERVYGTVVHAESKDEDVIEGAERPEPRTRELTRFEFIDALLLLARHRYATERRVEGGGTAAQDMAAALQTLIDNHIVPLVSKSNSGPIRSALQSEELHRVLPRITPGMVDVFDHYCEAVSNQRVYENQGVLNPQELAALLQHSGVLDFEAITESGDSTEQVCLRESRRLFALVQEYDPPDGAVGLRRLGDDAVQTELVYAEMLEAVAAVAVQRWSSPTMSNVSCVRRALQMVSALAEHPGSALTADEVATALAEADRYRPLRETSGEGAGAGTGAVSAAGLSELA